MRPPIKASKQTPSRNADRSCRTVAELKTEAVTLEEAVYDAGLCIPRHSHSTSGFVYIISGPHWSGYSRGGDTCNPHTLRFLPAGEPHENYFPVSSRCLHLELHQPILSLARDQGRTIDTPGQLTSTRAAFLGLRLYREFRRRDCFTSLEVDDITLHLLLSDCQMPAFRRGVVPHWLLQIREMVREEKGRPTLSELGRSVGRHPVQVSRQFHQHFGCTISEYVRRVRIGRAQTLLSQDDLAISEIALDCGFFDQSHFTAVFRRLTGVPPHRYREQTSREHGHRLQV